MLVGADYHGVLGFVVVLFQAKRTFEADGLFEDIVGRLIHIDYVCDWCDGR